MKKALQHSIIYFIIAGLFYLALSTVPVAAAFSGMLLFYMIHVFGVSLWGLFFRFSGFPQTEFVRDVMPFILISINSGVIFVFSLIKSRYPNDER